MAQFLEKGFFVSNLLLITDVARLRKIFGRLTEDKNIRLRVVNNLEKGGEEIAIEKPDVVFVQTHLSGLSADILLMHLKKQLGRKRSRFVLLASPGQTSDAILKPYQGWLDTSAEDSRLLSELQHLLVALLTKPKNSEEPASPEPLASADFIPQPQPVSGAEFSALFVQPPVHEMVLPQQVDTRLQFPVVAQTTSEPSLEEQGITYAPRQRLSVYSEFNSSFDNAVSTTPEAEPLELEAPAAEYAWNAETVDTVETSPPRSKRGMFLVWLAPVVIAVVVITYLQQQRSAPRPDTTTAKAAPAAVVKPAEQTSTPAQPAPVPAKAPTVASVVAPADQDRMSDKAVLTAIAETRSSKRPTAAAVSGTRPTSLPEFIPRYGLDKKFSAANPGWERYKGEVTEFKVLREAQAIKAIQVIDRGGNGVPESFMKAVFRQVTKKPAFGIDSSDKKEEYEVQRGTVADNIKVVYYRDEKGGKLRAFVLTWQ
jgi:CheY-like chemotaxis protein